MKSSSKLGASAAAAKVLLPPIRRTLRLARHEAAHAVATEFMGGRVARVVILKRPDKHGSWAYSVRDLRTFMSGLAAACVSSAGGAAEHRHGYLAAGRYPSGDYEVMSVRQGICGYDIALLDGLMQCWLKIPLVRDCAEAVARALLRRDLTGDDVRRIIRREKKKRGMK